jgi:hypothetical protein
MTGSLSLIWLQTRMVWHTFMGWYHFFPAVVHGQTIKVVPHKRAWGTTVIFFYRGIVQRMGFMARI